VSDIQSLLELQEIDGRIRALQQEVKDIPQRKEQESARLQSARAAVTKLVWFSGWYRFLRFVV
jgi:uncharacterized small protein (DUF1192 family)